MFLLEFFQDLSTGYRDEKQDNSAISLNDVRKTRLTLSHINRLRMTNDVRKFENEQKSIEITNQYAKPAAEPGSMAPSL